jgi:meso-butanediol dehydrogenase / (S,S)-butanediol dehydrogenase / diacetyl reductase
LPPAEPSGSVTLVTGAAGQIGAAVARGLARRGRALVLVDCDSAALHSLAEAISPDAARVVAIEADVTSEQDVRAAVQRAVDEVGVPTACVNAAGAEGPICPLEDLDLTDVARLYDVNVFSIFRVTKELLPLLKQRGEGRIVNVASGAGMGGVAFMSAYSSSKHAVVGITRSLAAEVARDGVSVNAVCPGCVESPMMDRIEERLAAVTGAAASFRDGIPIRRYADADEIANVIAYLVCDAPPYLTGTTLVVDGALRA